MHFYKMTYDTYCEIGSWLHLSGYDYALNERVILIFAIYICIQSMKRIGQLLLF